MVLANIIVYTTFFSGIALLLGTLIYAAALIHLISANVRNATSSNSLIHLLKNRTSTTFTIARWTIGVSTALFFASIITGVIFNPIA